MDKLPIVLDLTGTFVFALSGALAGTRRGLDLFGVIVLSFAAGNSGGITRDLLIGAVPPGAVGDWRYLGVSFVAGLVTFYFSRLIVRWSNAVLVFDAAGLALFAVAGSSKALLFGLNPVMATALGVVTGVGGGMVRDVLLAEIPTVLRAELYAVAALAAAATTQYSRHTYPRAVKGRSRGLLRRPRATAARPGKGQRMAPGWQGGTRLSGLVRVRWRGTQTVTQIACAQGFPSHNRPRRMATERTASACR